MSSLSLQTDTFALLTYFLVRKGDVTYTLGYIIAVVALLAPPPKVEGGYIVTNLAAICTQQPESPQFSYFNKYVFIVRVPSLCLMGD